MTSGTSAATPSTILSHFSMLSGCILSKITSRSVQCSFIRVTIQIGISTKKVELFTLRLVWNHGTDLRIHLHKVLSEILPYYVLTVCN